MKKLFAVAAILIFTATYVFAQADKITGYWLTEGNKSKVYVYKAKNGKYYGKITWLNEPNEEDGSPKLDKENPNENKRSKPLIGSIIVRGLTYDVDDKEWNGTIYDPENGETYDCYGWFDGNDTNKLLLKGYVLGIKWLGRETSWKRTEK